MSELAPFGDRALRFTLGARHRPTVLASLRALEGVADVVLAETIGAVILAPSASFEKVRGRVALYLATPSDAPKAVEMLRPPVTHAVRVVYDGPDLAALAAQLRITPEEVIALHSAPTYEVSMLGFMPGFAYLRGLDPRLVITPRSEPRPRVPAGSVAIAAEHTGIYPFASPGGWHLLGEALGARALDEQGARFAIGDRVRFEPTSRGTHVLTQANTSRAAAIAPRGAHLEVRKALGPAIVMDAGRTGHMHEAVPHGGALVPEALARANVAAGTAPTAAALEIYGPFALVSRGGRLTVGDDQGNARQLADGETFSVAPEGRTRVRYLAVRGGIDVREVLGGRGTMLGARMGGLDGRALRRGDLLQVGKLTISSVVAPKLPANHEAPVAIVSGPDLDDALLGAILSSTFRVGTASDRVGTRLDGPPLPARPVHNTHHRPSMPMVLGAIEVTPSGLVVLGPDHPTTGGYPVVAVVTSASLGSLFARPAGTPLRFALASRTVA